MDDAGVGQLLEVHYGPEDHGIGLRFRNTVFQLSVYLHVDGLGTMSALRLDGKR